MSNSIVYEVRHSAGAVLFVDLDHAEMFKRRILEAIPGPMPGTYNPPHGDPDHVRIVPRLVLGDCPNEELGLAS